MEPLSSCVSRSLARSLAHRTHSNALMYLSVRELAGAPGGESGATPSTAGLSTAWFKEPAGAWEAAG